MLRKLTYRTFLNAMAQKCFIREFWPHINSYVRMSVIIIEFPYLKINTGVSIINVKITKKVAVDHGQNKLTAQRWIRYHAVRVMLGIHTDF